METIKQNKILKITVIILLLVNLTTLATIWIKTNRLPTSQVNKIEKNKNKRNRPILIDELDLSEKQQDFYNAERNKHKVKTHLLRDMIRTNKSMIHTELFKENPDSLYIESLSDSIGKLNAQFERLNYMHFLKIQTILDPEQKVHFEELFKQMYSKPKSGKNCFQGGNKN